MSVRRASSQLLAQRSLHLRIVPRPANLSESREIFRVLQRFGDMTLYKHLRYEYHNPADNIALAIYRDADSAQRALDASPIRFALEKVTSDSAHDAEPRTDDIEGEEQIVPETPAEDGIGEMLRPSELITRTIVPADRDSHSETSQSSSSAAPMPFEAPVAAPKTTVSKWFQVTVDRSRVIHQDFVERQPYWKHFTPMKSMAQEDLAKKVPYSGLSDVSKRPPSAHRTPNHVLKKMSHYVEHRMPSLAAMYEEGERERRP